MIWLARFLLIVVLFHQWKFTHEIIILDSTVAKYMEKMVNEFQDAPKSSRHGSVIIPPRIGGNEESFLLPKVFIWCPMEHFSLEILCPVHHIPLKAGYFTDEFQRKSPRNPRLVYDLRGNVILIQRLYICKHGGIHHKYLSASSAILQNIPKLYGLALFPFVMFHKSACTKELVDFVETQILQGVSFLQICSGIASLNFKEYCERIERFSLFRQNSFGIEHQLQFEKFYHNELYAFPSNDKLMEIFLADYDSKQPIFEQEMENVARGSKCLMSDHTFKISKYIGASRGSDNKFIRQFENVYIMMNEHRQIVGWRLTKTTAFEEIKDLLQDFKTVLDEDLELVIVDDCCRVRALYQSIFPNVNVKLDLFHAVQRIIKTFPKGSETSRQISKEFGLIFREDGDLGESRNQATPEPDIIEKNLDNFIKSWKELLNCDSQKKTLHELENLRVHVKKGCLSGLPPGHGTECNERLHHTLNRSLLCGSSTISPEIAIAVLSLIFYSINCKRTGRKHKGNSRVVPFMPLSRHTIEDRTLESKTKRKSHFKTQQQEPLLDNVWKRSNIEKNNGSLREEEIVVIENTEDMLNDTISGLICENTIKLYETLEKINVDCNDRSFNSYDIPIMDLIGVKHMLDTNDDNTESNDFNDLQRNLKSFNLRIDHVEGDGDRAFTSIIKQLRKAKEWETENKLKDHLNEIGLNSTIENDVHRLRQLFVDVVQSNENYQMLLGMSKEEINDETERFRDEGTFCGNMGDLVVKVCSDLLQVPILVVTSLPGCPYIPFIPEEQIITNTLYIAYNAFGPGHYDATEYFTDIEDLPQKKNGKAGCSCGKNKAGQNISGSCIKSLDKADRGRKCPCVKQGISCDKNCRCKGCKNFTYILTDVKEAKQISNSSCRCGENSKSNIGNISCSNEIRKSKCPCLKRMQPCSANCFCKNCENGYGRNVRPKGISSSPPQKRKRPNPAPYKRGRAADFLVSQHASPSSSVWSDYETCLLKTTIAVMTSTLVSPSVSNITLLYNYVVGSRNCVESKLPVRGKNILQIQGKLKKLEEKQNVKIVKMGDN